MSQLFREISKEDKSAINQIHTFSFCLAVMLTLTQYSQKDARALASVCYGVMAYFMVDTVLSALYVLGLDRAPENSHPQNR